MAKKKRKAPSINSSSSADLAFTLLIFFLVVTSMDTDEGLARLLPRWVPEDQIQDQEIKKRNILNRYARRLSSSSPQLVSSLVTVALK